jgi:signal transduction histidine kinase
VTITLAGQTSEVRGDFGSLGSVCGVRLIIADDGTGFDPELHTQPNNRQAWGLLTMSERAESIGGRLVIDAAPGRGTRVIVKVGNV